MAFTFSPYETSQMNPWIALACCALFASAYFAGRHDGASLSEAAQVREEKIAKLAYDKAMEAAASAISKLEIKHVTYRQKIEREVKEVPVYRSVECQHTPDGLRILNAALTNGAEPAGDRQLSAKPGDAVGLKFRRDDGEAGRGLRDLFQVPGSGAHGEQK